MKYQLFLSYQDREIERYLYVDTTDDLIAFCDFLRSLDIPIISVKLCNT